MTSNETTARAVPVQFAAIDPYLETNIVTGEEVEVRGHDFVDWGRDNDFPGYLLGLREAVPTLGSIINGCTDYCVGNGGTIRVPAPTLGVGFRKDVTLDEFLAGSFRAWWTYGCAPFEVIRTQDMQGVAAINVLDPRWVRSDKEGTKFWYSEKWADKYSRKSTALVLPKWMKMGKVERSLYYVKNTADRTYPVPVYGPALVACDIERRVGSYHLNAIANGFSASYLINFSNGIPNDEQKAEIVKGLREKFTGEQNAGRIFTNFSDDRLHGVEVKKLDIDDWGLKYQELQKYSRAQIFTSFRATPILFGIVAESSLIGAEQNYADAFTLFNRTMIRPAQRTILAALDRILGVDGAVTIEPFTMEDRAND